MVMGDGHVVCGGVCVPSGAHIEVRFHLPLVLLGQLPPHLLDRLPQLLLGFGVLLEEVRQLKVPSREKGRTSLLPAALGGAFHHIRLCLQVTFDAVQAVVPAEQLEETGACRLPGICGHRPNQRCSTGSRESSQCFGRHESPTLRSEQAVGACR